MSQQSKMVQTQKARSETPLRDSILRKGAPLQRSAVTTTPPSSLSQPDNHTNTSQESRFSYDFSQVPVHSDATAVSSAQVPDVAVPTEAHGVQSRGTVHHVPTLPPIMDTVQLAATDGARPLNASVRGTLEESLSHDFSQVRVHQGPASEVAAQRLGARAYTLGRDIYLGAEARYLSRF